MRTFPNFGVHVPGDIPEHVSLTLRSTGSQGGDSGHGGVTTLHIFSDGGDNTYGAATSDEACTLHSDGVLIQAAGDWEGQGLIQGLIRLGQELQRILDMHETMRNAYLALEEEDLQ